MSVPEPKYVLDLAQRIVGAESHLAELQAEWNAIFTGAGVSPPASVAPSAATAAAKGPYPDGPAAKVLAALDSETHSVWTADRLEKHTGLTLKQVQKALFNLADAHKIQRVSRGLYADLSYQPNDLPLPRQEASVN